MPQGYRVVFTAPRQVALEVQEWGEPGHGQVLLKTERTLISTGTELTALSGDFPPGSRWAEYIQYPCSIGYSNAATVVVAGEGVERVRPGDRVASTSAHATYALRRAADVWPVPAEVDAEPAAFATLAEIVMGGVRRSRLSFGESVVIVGAGLLGQLAAHFCRVAGAWPIIVLDPAEPRLESARRMGATDALPVPAADARGEVEQRTRGRLADVVFEVTGSPAAMPGAVKLARRQGRVVLLGSPRGPVSIDLHDEVHSFSLELIGAHNSAHPPAETPNSPWSIARHVELFLDWQRAGMVDVRPLVTHRYAWRDAPRAFEMLLEDRTRALGVVLDWGVEG